MSSTGMEQVLPFKGPAIVFGNHTHTLDPFFISAMYPYTIRWVAGSYLFKMKGVSFLLRHLVGSIPKVQGRSDLETIRSISRVLKEAGIHNAAVAYSINWAAGLDAEGVSFLEDESIERLASSIIRIAEETLSSL